MTDQVVEEKPEDLLLDESGNVIADEQKPTDKVEADTTLKSEEETHDDDEPEGDDETEDETEARRERNRQRRKENKENRKNYIESLRREIAARDELLQRQEERISAIERRSHGADLAAVDSELKRASDAYEYFKRQHAQAVTAANGELATAAFEKMQAAMNRAQQLTQVKKAAQTRQPTTPPLDPRLKAHAEGWLERNNWYDPAGGDMDSKVALSVDQAMAAEGWNPTTAQYWEELDARLKKYLPHKFNQGYNKSNRTADKAPVAGSGRESSAQTSGGYRLSADRVQALKDAGLWDDPKARAEAVKRFQQYDKDQGAR